MRRITYTSKPEEFDSNLKIRRSMPLKAINNVIKEFEQNDNSELVVHQSFIEGWRVSVCNKDIVYGFHCCAYNDFERFQALNRGTPF